eukprot:6585530-Prorocentrum_lima.AAC.1
MGCKGVYKTLAQTGNEQPLWPFNVIAGTTRSETKHSMEESTIRRLLWDHFNLWMTGILPQGEDGV